MTILFINYIFNIVIGVELNLIVENNWGIV